MILWDLFNKTPDHIFGVDIGAVRNAYTFYIRHTYGSQEFGRLEARCVRRSNAELREVAVLTKPSNAQVKWFKRRMDSGEKSGPELNGDLDDENWLRRFITNEPTYLWQFPKAY